MNLTVDFKGNCGEASDGPKCITSEGMPPSHHATVNGQPISESNCIIGNGGAKVYSISLIKKDASTFQICVDSQGPSGFSSGFLYLGFTDASGDTYYLKIFSSTRKEHTVNYTSSAPNIVKIWWCNNPFEGGKRIKLLSYTEMRMPKKKELLDY